MKSFIHIHSRHGRRVEAIRNFNLIENQICKRALRIRLFELFLVDTRFNRFDVLYNLGESLRKMFGQGLAALLELF